MANYGKYYIAVRLLLLKQYLEANAGRNRIVKRRELEQLLEKHDMPVEKKTLYCLLIAGRNRGIGRDSLVNLLDRFPIVVDCPLPKIPCFTVQDIFGKTVHESFLSWEAHPHFLHQKHPPKRKNRKHIFTDFSERMCFLAFFLRKVGFELFTV